MREKKGIISTVREKLNSSTTNVNHSTDSLTQKLSADTLSRSTDSLKHSKWNAKGANQKYDSIQQVLKIKNKLTTVTDTVTKRITKPIDKIKQGADSLQQKADNFLQRRVDSVEQKLNKPLVKVNSKISSIEKPVEQKVEGATRAIDQKTDKLQTGVQTGLDKATDGTVKAPMKDLNFTGINEGSRQGGIPDVDISNTDIPGLEMDLPGITAPNESLKLPDSKLNVDHLKDKAKLKIPESNKINGVKGEMGKVDSNLAEAGKHQEELQGLKKMDSASIKSAGNKAEEKIKDLDQVKGIEEQTQVLTKQQAEYKIMIERYKDKKLVQQELTRKSKDIVNDKLNHNTPEVKKAISAFNKKSEAKSIKEILSKKNNSMAGKPTGQRLIPGITLQSYKREVFMIDFGLQLGYRLTGRLRTGVGYVYRAGFSESYPSFIKGHNIYGVRAYTEFLIRKGIYVHAEYERLNASYSPNQTPEEKQIVSAGYFGLGKQFNISRKVKGHTLALYRAEFTGTLLDQSKINLRLGFDLRTDKKRKNYEKL
jgi:hypothetical protein